MRLLLAAGLAMVVSGCSGSAPPSEPAVSATATVAVSPEPTAEPSPTPDTSLAAACDALAEVRQMGNLVETMTRAAADALDGDAAGWESASLALVDQSNSVVAALDDVPDEGEFHQFKVQALTLVIGLSDVILSYDTAASNGSLRAFNRGTDQLSDLQSTVDDLNDEAATFEEGC